MAAVEPEQTGGRREASPLKGNNDASPDAETVTITEQELDKLWRWNWYAAILHFLTGIVIFAITDADNYVPSYTNFPNDLRGNPDLWGPSPKKHREVAVGYFSGIFLLLASVDHFVCATFGRSKYEYYLRRSQNHFRWAEYSISASIMHIMIAMLSGVMDMHLLTCIFGLTMTTMLFGSLQELMNWKLQGQPDAKSMIPFWFGCVPHLFNWAIIVCYFFYGVSNGDPPAFVWAIIFILLILDSTFAINMYLQQKEIGAWSSYVKGEMTFMILSFTAKQLLAWLNYGGTASLSNEKA